MNRLSAFLLLAACAPDDPGVAPLRRLSPTQHARTVADLLGYPMDGALWPGPDGGAWTEDHAEQLGLAEPWPYPLPPEEGLDGFDGLAQGQASSAALAEALQRSALHYALWFEAAPYGLTCGSLSGLSTREAEACAGDSVERLGHRAFRRTLTEAETHRLLETHDAHVAEHGVADGLRLSVAAVLTAPQFLHRVELGVEQDKRGDGVVPLTDFEVASRLSYLLWDSMPDPALFEAAAEGALHTPKQVEEQARRMLADGRARGALTRFHAQWLELDRVYDNQPALEPYAAEVVPDFDGFSGDVDDLQDAEEYWGGALIGLRAGMVREAERFVEHTVFDGGGTLSNLLTDPHGFVTDVRFVEQFTASTAQIYGVTEDDLHAAPNYRYAFDDGNLSYELVLRPATFPAGQRAGVLTLGAVLAGRAHPVHPSPVERGVFVLERLACEDLGQPPPAAAGTEPPDTLDAESTNRQRLLAVTSEAACAGCHDRINPAGFALERFDSVGAWREEDHGQPVDASGTLRLTGGETLRFDGPVGLARQLAASPQVRSCYAQRWLTVALGRPVERGDDPATDAVLDAFVEDDRVLELLIAIVRSDAFLHKRLPEAP